MVFMVFVVSKYPSKQVGNLVIEWHNGFSVFMVFVVFVVLKYPSKQFNNLVIELAVFRFLWFLWFL